jgi:predicted Zn-dependent protease
MTAPASYGARFFMPVAATPFFASLHTSNVRATRVAPNAMRQRIGLLALSVALAISGQPLYAQTNNPSPLVISGNRLPNLGDGIDIPLGVERRLGENIAREIYRDPDYIDDPVLGDYVQSFWQVLLNAARQRGELTPELEQQFAWEVTLIRDRSINAFALPGGYLGVHLGLISAVSNGGELASVLAHELSHVTQRHIARMMSQQGRQGPMVIGAMILGMLAASRTPSASGMSAANAVMVGGQAAAIQSQLNFSRDMEREADRVGYGVMTDAGFEPQGFVTMFEKLQQAARLNDNGSFPYLRSHPMTTERIADAQARQQLLPVKPSVVTTPLHAMMSARALVLTNPGIDALRGLSVQAASSTVATAPLWRQAGTLYAAAMAEMRQRDWVNARRTLARLEALPLTDPAAQRVVLLFKAELALQSGEAMQAVNLLNTKTSVININDRASRLLLAQSRVATHLPAQGKLAADDLVMWVNRMPRDANAWLYLSAAYELQGDTLRAIRAQAEARAAELDYAAALDRFKAAQAVAYQLAKEGKLDRSGNIEASIVDARLRELERLRREQMLER